MLMRNYSTRGKHYAFPFSPFTFIDHYCCAAYFTIPAPHRTSLSAPIARAELLSQVVNEGNFSPPSSHPWGFYTSVISLEKNLSEPIGFRKRDTLRCYINNKRAENFERKYLLLLSISNSFLVDVLPKINWFQAVIIVYFPTRKNLSKAYSSNYLKYT